MLVTSYSLNTAPAGAAGAAPDAQAEDANAGWGAAWGTVVVALARGAPAAAAASAPTLAQYALGLAAAVDWPLVLTLGAVVGAGLAAEHYFGDAAQASSHEAIRRANAQPMPPGVLPQQDVSGADDGTQAPAPSDDQALPDWARPVASEPEKKPLTPAEPAQDATAPAAAESAAELAAEPAAEGKNSEAPAKLAKKRPANQNHGDDSSELYRTVMHNLGVSTTSEELHHANIENSDPLIRDAVAEVKGAPTSAGHVKLADTQPGDPLRTEQEMRVTDALQELERRLRLDVEIRDALLTYLFRLRHTE